MLQGLICEVLPHIGLLTDALNGKRYANNEEVKEAVQPWLRGWPKEFFANEITSCKKYGARV